MKKYLIPLLSITALVGSSSIASASTTPPVDVTSVAAPAASVPDHTIDLRDEEILSVASPVSLGIQSLSAQARTSIAAAETEAPETEGPDTDGPGGPDHQFEGEETGQH